jgi:hypothetical protein
MKWRERRRIEKPRERGWWESFVNIEHPAETPGLVQNCPNKHCDDRHDTNANAAGRSR